MEKEHSDLIETLQKVCRGFNLRDLLIDMQNYYLEAADNGVLFISGENSLEGIEKMYINLGGRFNNFSGIVKSIYITFKEERYLKKCVERMNSVVVVEGVEIQSNEESSQVCLQVDFV